jgi:hypothetical protein
LNNIIDVRFKKRYGTKKKEVIEKLKNGEFTSKAEPPYQNEFSVHQDTY